MKVLHLLSSTGYHGAENMVVELIHQLSKLNIKNYIGLFNQKEFNKEILNKVENYVEDAVIFPCNGRMDIKTIFLLHKYINKENIEILHSHKYKTNLYSLLSIFGTDCKLVSTCHNWLGNSFKMYFYAQTDKILLHFFNAVIGVSDEITNELRKYVAHNKVRKIENGIDIERYFRINRKEEAKKEFGLEGKKVIGFIGRLSKDKGLSFLLKAVHHLILKGNDDINILIVGEGNFSENLKSQVNSLGITDRVIFTGHRNDTPMVYSALDIFVLPSLKEGFPMVILEAMASGIPVVATKVGDIPLIIENNISGLIVVPEDVIGLCNAINEIFNNNDKAEQFAKYGSERVIEKYSSIIMAKKYKEIYKEVLK